MKRLLPIIFLVNFFSHAQLQPALFQFKTDTVIRWHYQFGEEFSSKSIDENRWHMRYPWGGLLLDQKQWAVPEMIAVNDGNLELKAVEVNKKVQVENWMINQAQAKELQIDVKNDSVYLDYLTSCLWSKDTFRYGYFECRAIVPEGKGLWPAFWLYGQNQKDEIDFMEMKGERSHDIHVDVHLPNRKDYVKNTFGLKKDWGGWVRMKNQLVGQPVIYSGIWLPNSLTYFVNGVPVSHFDGDFETPMNIVLNLAVARDGFAFNPGPDAQTKFPATFTVDYLRVWQLDAQLPLIKASFPELEVANLKGAQTAIKKQVSLIYPKKKLEQEQGFVTFIPLNWHSYEVQTNGVSSLEVSAWIGSEQHPEFLQGLTIEKEAKDDNRMTVTDQGKFKIELLNAPKELEIELKVGSQKIRFKPQ